MKKEIWLTGVMIASVLIAACTASSTDIGEIEATDEAIALYYPNLRAGDHTLDIAYRMAVGDLFTNIQQYKSLYSGKVVPVLIAGVDYNTPWIRDASINAWSGGSLLVPEVAKNTLLSVLNEYEDGTLRPKGQYWDAVIWISGAWNHYLVTGDREFLQVAFRVARDMLTYYEDTEFNAVYGLFRGLGWSDGVAAYPAKYANTGMQSGAFLWPEYNQDKVSQPGFGIPMMAISTNALYYNAYRVTGKMARVLDEEGQEEWNTKAAALKEAINRHLWNENTGVYSFYIDEEGTCELQEALGNAYAMMFGITDDQQAASIFRNQYVSPHGVTCGWPELPRFQTDPDGMSFGRHNVTVWPQIQGMWADVAARYGKVEVFTHELQALAANAVRDMQFSEIYHPVTGERYGGMQANGQEIGLWESTRRQTWSATAYLRMVYSGLFGIVLEEGGLRFSPVLPEGIGPVSLNGLKYRNMLLNITVSGEGTEITSFKVDGKEQDAPLIPATGQGKLLVEIEVK
ncbi:MAG: amylo-alpha-1,6-glucosidase [Bacteroidota bacterium]